MSGFEPLLIPLAWGALRLTASLVTAGFKKLVGVEDESDALLQWSGDVVLNARDESRRTQQKVSGAASRALQQDSQEAQHGLATLGSDLRSGLGTIGMAVMSEATGIRTDVREVKRDLASVRESVEDCRAENMEFFASFTAGLEAAQQGIEIMRSAPLEEARMSLKNFEGSKGNVRFLETAHSKALTALVQGHTLDVKLSAAVIAVSAGYIHMSKVDCPSEAKDFTVNATLANVISHFAPTWSDPSRASKADGKKTVSFLLNIVSCVRALPPESVPVLSNLDKRLLPAFGALCSAEPELRRMYHTVAGVAVRAMLEQQTMKGLFQLAEEVDVDVDACTSKESVIQALLASGKCLLPSGATSGQAVIKSNPPVPTRVSPVKAMPAPVRDARTDRTVLMELFNTTKGPSWTTSTAWGTSSSLGEWYGVTVNAEGRVTKLDLEKNNLTGPIPPSLGGLTALLLLRLDGNELSGAIPPELGRLTALTRLDLDVNNLSGAIPPELGRLTALTRLDLDGNNLSGPIPSALGGLTALRELYLNTNKLEGTIPPELGGLTALTWLGLSNSNLSGTIPPELGGLMALAGLNLSNNNLSGPIPSALGGLTALQELYLNTNKLEGSIPQEFRQLKALEYAIFFRNNFNGTKADVQQLLPDCGVYWHSRSD